jgi:DNA-binding NtrC family response regulator
MPNARRILIVDDDTELREALVEQLSLHEEFEAIAAESGTKGVQAAKGGRSTSSSWMSVSTPDEIGSQKRKRIPAVVARLLRARNPLASPPFICEKNVPM